MAKFIMELPNDEIKRLAELGAGAEKMMGKMTQAGAKTVFENVKRNMKSVFKESEELVKCLVVTREYKTRADDGVNTKVGFYGYFVNDQGKEVPAPLVVQAREYGTSRGEMKKPFFRRSFNKSQITKAMLEVQKEYIPDD